ncbi:MAG: PIG-L deacetylase family protein, partial [Candidatus Levyibacteriota bacterium]
MNLKNQSILIVAPHPDDEAICCGGLIMKAKKEKAKVFVLYMSIGFSRQLQTGKTQSSIRIREAKNAAKYGNFSYEIVFNGDEFLKLDVVPQNTIINIIENTIQKIKPTIVCIPSRGSFNQDHRAISTACITALRPLPKKLSHQPTVILECEEPYT